MQNKKHIPPEKLGLCQYFGHILEGVFKNYKDFSNSTGDTYPIEE